MTTGGKPGTLPAGLKPPTSRRQAAHVVEPDGSIVEVRNVTTYSLTEEATPLTPDDTTGAVGGFTVTFDPILSTPHDIKGYRGKTLFLDDLGQGRTVGVVASAGSTSSIPQITVQSRLNLLAVSRRALPFTGILQDAITYYLGLCGITDMTSVYIDSSIATIEVTLVGWYQPVWNQLKKMAAVYGFEMALVSDQIVFRPVRQRTGQSYRDSAVDWAIDDSNTALEIVVNYYEATRLEPGDVTIDPTSDNGYPTLIPPWNNTGTGSVDGGYGVGGGAGGG